MLPCIVAAHPTNHMSHAKGNAPLKLGMDVLLEAHRAGYRLLPDETAAVQFHRAIFTEVLIGFMATHWRDVKLDTVDYYTFSTLFCPVVAHIRGHWKGLAAHAGMPRDSTFAAAFRNWGRKLAGIPATDPRTLSTEETGRWYYTRFFRPDFLGRTGCANEEFLHFRTGRDGACMPMAEHPANERTCANGRFAEADRFRRQGKTDPWRILPTGPSSGGGDGGSDGGMGFPFASTLTKEQNDEFYEGQRAAEEVMLLFPEAPAGRVAAAGPAAASRERVAIALPRGSRRVLRFT